jgi:Putative beta-barrel porin-2, OmpL-like. bbp2/Carboxypeptidase regulatory-like domain
MSTYSEVGIGKPITAVPVCAAVLLSILCTPVLCTPVLGQSGAGMVGGAIHDSKDGKPVPEARINAYNVDTGMNRVTVTDSGGRFQFPGLDPGKYELAITKDGFRKASGRVELEPRHTAQIDFALQTIDTDSALTEREKQLLERLERLENRLAAMETKETAPQVAGYRAPQSQEPLVATLGPVTLPSAAASFPTPSFPDPGSQVSGKTSVPRPATPVAPPEHIIPEALQAPPIVVGVDNDTPFAYGDFTWLNGSPRTKDTVLDTKFFTPEVRFDTHYMEDFNQPKDHTIVGSTESFRSGEVQIEQASVGGDFHWQNVRGRILLMEGLFATTTPRNDASAGVGQWDLRDAYRYVSEAYGGYHFNVNHGLNVDAGIFVSYIGLFSYYNFDNWTYQPSYVSSNTPWFFNGVRVQWFPTNKLKIEPWFINGWQSYAKFNGHPGLGGQILWMPKDWLKIVGNQYGYGQDNLGLPKTQRIHTDDSIEVRYYSNPTSTGLSKMAFSLTGDAGCQYGGGISCTGAPSQNKSSFVGWMLYDRMWFNKDKLALTLGGGEMSNWGRYLTLLPPIDGADAVSGTPYFTENAGQRAHMWDSTINVQYMPRQYITWWIEAGYRHSDVPYFAGRGGVTPPGGNNGAPQYYTCMSGATSGTATLAAAQAACGGASNVWFPDLRRSDAKLSLGVMVKF